MEEEKDKLHKIEEDLEILKYYGCGNRDISGYKCSGRGIQCRACKKKIREMEIEIGARSEEREVAMKKAIKWSENLNPIDLPEKDLFALLDMLKG